MELQLREKAEITSVLHSLAESRESDPTNFLNELNDAAQKALDIAGIGPREQEVAQQSPGQGQTITADPGLQSEYRPSAVQNEGALSRDQIETLQRTEGLIDRLERAGYGQPEPRDDWLGRMLDNHQRGHMQSDIFTEAVVGLVWMAGKAAQQLLTSPEQQHSESLISELRSEVSKMARAAETQLAHSHIRAAGAERDNVMGQAISQARDLWRSGDQQGADKLITQTHANLNRDARKQHMVYEPTADHKKIVGEAANREKQRDKALEKGAEATHDNYKSRNLDKSLAR